MNKNVKSYQSWKKEDLIKHIIALEENFRKEDDSFLKTFRWAGNLGQWIWYFDQNKVLFNEKKVTNIGYHPKEIGQVGFEFFTNKLHPDDYEAVMQNMRDHLSGQTEAYEVEYRILHKDGYYVWYYDRGVVTKKDEHGAPLILQGIVFDITESKEVEKKLIELSEKDALTKSYNRRMFFKHLKLQIELNKKEKMPFALIMFDLDRFKKVNDTY